MYFLGYDLKLYFFVYKIIILNAPLKVRCLLFEENLIGSAYDKEFYSFLSFFLIAMTRIWFKQIKVMIQISYK
jgi:hypothetical protein